MAASRHNTYLTTPGGLSEPQAVATEPILTERGALYERAPLVNPFQQRIAVLMADKRSIEAELRELRDKLKYGLCERCGTEFVRRRITKRYCSQRCTALSAPGGRPANYSLDLIAANLDVLEASGLLTPRSMDLVRRLVDVRNAHALGEQSGLSHQRISQIALKAAKAVQLITRMRAALSQQSTTTSSPAPQNASSLR